MLSSIFSYGGIDHTLDSMDTDTDMDIDSCKRGKISSAEEDDFSSLDHLKRVDSIVESPERPFVILKKYASRCRRLNGENLNSNFPSFGKECEVSLGASVETLIQLGAEKFIKSSSKVGDEVSVLSHPYPGSILCQSGADFEGARLVQRLLSCVEKVDERKYEEAYELLLECDGKSSARGSVVERLVFYFCGGLFERIDRETGRITVRGEKVEDPLVALRSPDETVLAFHNELPISQITKFAGVQALVDNLGDARKVHLIDLEIRKGIHSIILMQALVDRRGARLELLKVSAVCVGAGSRGGVEATGRRLVSFARSLGLSLCFRVVEVDDLLDLDERRFDVDVEEVVAVYSEYTLTHVIGRPDRLEHVMMVLRRLSFRVMVVAEVEANLNSPVFVERFVEALLFYGAYFESMADCLRSVEQRCIAEATCFGPSIRNVVAAEGRERKIRHVEMGVWRSFFTRFGFEETELSMSSVYQANLVVKGFASGSFFTFDVDGKSLIIGWKGTPMSSISAWRFDVPNNVDNPV